MTRLFWEASYVGHRGCSAGSSTIMGLGFPRLVLLLLSVNRILLTSSNNVLGEFSSDTYAASLEPGKTSLLYFSRAELSNNVIFLEELQKSAPILQDYGIHVAKVNCAEEDAGKFCAEANAYLFRGDKLLREFPTDTLFDVNAIVANVLFVLLYNKVKYITSILELQNLEDTLKGRKNIVLVYVQAVGTPEHRSVMEAAFVHGSAHQFVLTTETSLLKDVSTEEPSQVSAELFFIHCKSASKQKCRRTLLEQPLTILNVHRFLKLMVLPLVGEVSGDPDTFTSVHLQLGLPVIFILSQQETYEADVETAEEVAWQFLGKAGVAILMREKSGVPIPPDTNVAVKRAEENTAVKYIQLESIHQIRDVLYNLNEKEAEKPAENQGDPEVQDDEVAEAVYRDRKRVLPLELVPALTDETFKMVPTAPGYTAVLFYVSWNPVSMAFLESVADMSVKYKGLLDVSLARVNCADWTDVCQKESVTSIPVVKIYRAGEEPLLYPGMMGSEALACYLMLMKQECPIQLKTTEDMEEYLSGNMQKTSLPDNYVSILGVFTPRDTKEANDFIQAGKSLRGFAMVGIYIGKETSVLAEKYHAHPPAVLISMQPMQKVRAISLQGIPPDEILPLLRLEMLGEFPEVTVETLPSLLQSQRPLLILFSEGAPSHHHERHVLSLLRGRYLQPYKACWLNLLKTPEGYEVLRKYFGLIPHLPVLILITFGSRGQVFALPADQPITEVSILYWLEMIKAEEEAPVYSLSDQDWGPPLPDYDFLAMMDAADPNLAAQKVRINMKPQKRKKAELSTDEKEAGAKPRPGKILRGTVPKFLESEEGSELHAEL